jgi:hypothetical protein
MILIILDLITVTTYLSTINIVVSKKLNYVKFRFLNLKQNLLNFKLLLWFTVLKCSSLTVNKFVNPEDGTNSKSRNVGF